MKSEEKYQLLKKKILAYNEIFEDFPGEPDTFDAMHRKIVRVYSELLLTAVKSGKDILRGGLIPIYSDSLRYVIFYSPKTKMKTKRLTITFSSISGHYGIVQIVNNEKMVEPKIKVYFCDQEISYIKGLQYAGQAVSESFLDVANNFEKTKPVIITPLSG